MRKLTDKQARYVELRQGGKAHIESYRLAYDVPKLPPKDASNRALRLEKLPHVASKITEFEEKVIEQVVAKKADVAFDHQEEVRVHLRAGIERALAIDNIEGAAKLIDMLGKMDACANFLNEQPSEEKPNSETNINIGLSPLDAISHTLKQAKTNGVAKH